MSYAIAVNRPLPALSGRRTRPGPILKWAGGKSRLIPALQPYFPPTFKNYFEPFLGGGAVFFHLLPPKAVLSDLNPELINCYKVVRDNVDHLIKLLQKHQNDKQYYYSVRLQDINKLSAEERAARLIYLNKTCFNGLYRVNSKGLFNVPFGSYKNPTICDIDKLRAASKLLQNVSLSCDPFEETLKQARRGDFIYLDPPYQPISKTANFTGYTKNSFRSADQERLAKLVRTLTRRGCHIMLSNSDNEYIRDLYFDFRIEIVHATRAINCKADRRGAINELLILNY